MPDADGAIKGQGWSRRREAAWERIFRPRCKNLHTFWNDEPACSVCGVVWKSRLPENARPPAEQPTVESCLSLTPKTPTA